MLSLYPVRGPDCEVDSLLHPPSRVLLHRAAVARRQRPIPGARGDAQRPEKEARHKRQLLHQLPGSHDGQGVTCSLPRPLRCLQRHLLVLLPDLFRHPMNPRRRVTFTGQGGQ